MATRRQLTLQRDQLAAAKSVLADINIRIGRHLLGCGPCVCGQQSMRGLCDAGWQLAKEQSRARAAVCRVEDERSAGPAQGTLW